MQRAHRPSSQRSNVAGRLKRNKTRSRQGTIRSESNVQWNNNTQRRQRRWYHRFSAAVRRLFRKRQCRRVVPDTYVSLDRRHNASRRDVSGRPRHGQLDVLHMTRPATEVLYLDCDDQRDSSIRPATPTPHRHARSLPDTCLAHTQFGFAYGGTSGAGRSVDGQQLNQNMNNVHRDTHNGWRRWRPARRAGNRRDRRTRLAGADAGRQSLSDGARTLPLHPCPSPLVHTPQTRLLGQFHLCPLNDNPMPASGANEKVPLLDYEAQETLHAAPPVGHHYVDHVLNMPLEGGYYTCVPGRPRSPPPPYPSIAFGHDTLM